ncbi:24214_t:CDS:2, partial [Gigaspora rosea]
RSLSMSVLAMSNSSKLVRFFRGSKELTKCSDTRTRTRIKGEDEKVGGIER